jgi:hypothetical protein
MFRVVVAAVLAALALSAPASAEPRLTVSRARLRAALHCSGDLHGAAKRPIMLVTGTGSSGDEFRLFEKGATDAHGAPVCWVNFPHFTTADVQVSVQYLVYGLRVMARRADRRVAVFGISQGGLLPRIALTYWPSLRRKVSDVVAVAGTQHGTNRFKASDCRPAGCPPAVWQQGRGSQFLRALNRQGRDETPGRRTAWTTVRTSTDEVVQPQTGRHPTSSLRGASNVLIQAVCPGRRVSHIGSGVDSVTWAVLLDALHYKGPGRASRLPQDVCDHPYGPGLDAAQTSAFVAAGVGLAASRIASQPRMPREPRVRAWARR